MDIVLAVVVITVVEVGVLTFAFRAFERAEESRARVELQQIVQAERARPRFFGDAPVVGTADRAPLEALLARLERHVLLEQEAAESFLRNPTAESLHHRAPSRVHLTH